MKNIGEPTDTFSLSRWLLIPYFKRLFALSQAQPTQAPEFSRSRFQPFRTIPYQDPPFVYLPKKVEKKQAYYLLLALIKSHKFQIFTGFLTCLLWTIFNTLTPKVVKEFFRLMKDSQLEGIEIAQANYLTQTFIGLQILRIITSANTKRLFGQLSIKITGALSIELVNKSLKLSSGCRQLLPQSEIYQMENTDMQAISHLFKEFWVITDVPFTIIASIFLLFNQSLSFGLVGLYWICLIFFLQRWLTELMSKSINRKLRLTEKRSRINYQLMEKMPQARLALSEGVFVEKNNDFFLKELAQYKQFHRLMTIFDISLIILPLVCVISLIFYDQHEAVSFTIQEVYILLTLIGLCYKPFKNLRKFSLTFSEAVYSLNRFAIFLELPEKKHSQTIKNHDILVPKLSVKADTMTFTASGSTKNTGFYFQKGITLQSGERLYVLGKKGQGISQFLKSLLGDLQLVKGQIILQGSFAYLPRQNFFSDENVSQNISFYSPSISEAAIENIYKSVDLHEDLEIRGGLDQKVKMNTFSELELKKIGIARVLVSNRKVIILDCPFIGLSVATVEKIDKILRQRQSEGAMVIIAERYIQLAESHDKVIIVQKGQIKQYGEFQTLSQDPESQLHLFERASKMSLSDRISYLNIVKQFQRKIIRMAYLNSFVEQLNNNKQKEQRQKKVDQLCRIVGKYSLKLKKKEEKKKVQEKKVEKKSFSVYARVVLKYLPLSDWVLSMFLILVIELLNILIQFQFGTQYKQGGKTRLSTLKQLMKYELALTILLALFIFLLKQIQFEVSSIIANHIYKNSIKGIVQQKLSYYYKNHSSILAQKYNHDYEEIFSSIHFIFEIIKFVVVLISTIVSINASARTVISLTLITSLIYYLLLKFYRKSKQSLIRSYPHYKYEFVKVFDQIIEGTHIINVFGKNDEAVAKAKKGFMNVAAFKLTSNTVQICEEALCEVAGTMIVALGLEYGTKMKLQEGDNNQALVAVSVLLLLNLSDVLKAILTTFLKLQTYYRLKLLSYIEIIDLQSPQINEHCKKPFRHSIEFKERWLQNSDNPIFQLYPLSLKIGDYQKILLIEKDSNVRNNILSSLTNNLLDHSEYNKRCNVDVITIGRQLINFISKEELNRLIGVLLPENFYFTGTLKQNLRWNIPEYQSKNAAKLAEAINISKEVPDFDSHGLETVVNGQDHNKSLSRKIAMLRILLKKPKIVIIKDTPWVVGSKDVIKWLKESNIHCTVIGISDNPTGVRNEERVVLLEKGKVVQDGKPQDLIKNVMSQTGQLLRLSENQSVELWRAEKEQNPLMIKQKRRELMKAIIESFLTRGTL